MSAPKSPRPTPTGEVFVELTAPADARWLFAQVEALHPRRWRVVERRSARRFVVAIEPASQALELGRTLAVAPQIRVIEPDLAWPLRGCGTARTPHTRDAPPPGQWVLRNHGDRPGLLRGADARVLDAWALLGSTGSRDLVVAVIDDGVDLDHPAFSSGGKLHAPRDFDRDGDDPRPDTARRDWHGTACAGVAVGEPGRGSGAPSLLGVAPGCRLMPLRFQRTMTDRAVEDWFDWAEQAGADVVSCSWGGTSRFFPLSTRKREALQRCAERGRGGLGAVICFAVGNDALDIDDPPRSLEGFALSEHVMAVSACTGMDEPTSYANFGDAVFVAAPSSGAGGGVISCDVRGADRGFTEGDYNPHFGGTSAACPIVAGVAALVLSANPALTGAEVRALIARTARRIGPAEAYRAGPLGPRSRALGHGCVDAAAAVRLAGGAATLALER